MQHICKATGFTLSNHRVYIDSPIRRALFFHQVDKYSYLEKNFLFKQKMDFNIEMVTLIALIVISFSFPSFLFLYFSF